MKKSRDSSESRISEEEEEEEEEEAPLTRASAPKLDAAVEEIVRTEGDYVVALRTLVSGYIPKLQELLEADELVTIFGNAQTILGVHVELLQRLEAARTISTLDEEVAGVSAAFRAIMPFLKLYALYCQLRCLSRGA